MYFDIFRISNMIGIDVQFFNIVGKCRQLQLLQYHFNILTVSAAAAVVVADTGYPRAT
jgi:hypothetical protein